MDTQKIGALLKHGALTDEHVEKMFAHPEKEKIVGAVANASGVRDILPENIANRIVKDRSLLKHHPKAIDFGLSGSGSDEYFKENAGRQPTDDHTETRHHITALLTAANQGASYGHLIRQEYHKLPSQIRDRVISGIRHSTTDDLNSLEVGNSETANNLADHKNSDDKTMFNIKDSKMSPATRETSLLRMVENRHNKLSGYAVDSVRRHLLSNPEASRYSINRAVAQHPATMDHTLHDIVGEDDPGYGTLSAIARHPNASEETKAKLKEKFGDV
jgi:hypothetical protein